MYFIASLLLIVPIAFGSAPVTSSPPVLVWGVDTPKATSIFQPVTTAQFRKIIRNLQKNNMIVIYLASELAAKDINCDLCFPYLTKIQPMNYYSQVEEPLNAVERVAEKTGDIIWHIPKISEMGSLEAEMELPCQKGEIHAFSFNDRNLLAHDAAMAVATYQFSDCPVVHVYTAYTEEDKALQRRKSQKTQHMSIKNKIDGQPSNSDTEVELQPHQISQSQADNMTVLRNEMIVLTFRSILLATKEQRSVLSPFNRTEVMLAQGREPLQVGLLNSHDIFGGIVMVLNTELGPLIVELIPSQGNWYLTRMIFMNNTHYPRDLYFYGFEFSLCCTDITVYSSEASRLSFFDFHLDILWQDKDNGLDLQYEVKPCWNCSILMTPTMAQTIFVVLIIAAILWMGLAILLSIGQNQLMQNANDPDLHIKTDT
uniref:Uncharacterized protein, isoform A n=2 Tax=Drosophila melanogaster TaxID=7227 RepID=Q9VK83_DROME|nr:uncharacterized protein Dmel_CG5421, isoform B [Drosophila melanogaster]NP_609569.1 uncharacterized protein Dmel_CG5421, isoform A [Drosophila melanogaster]AAF53196.1 uncharacterized protein Dmel_CG5421, isoform A [Drosophila melanogaster]AGB92953.1 uncharacterized protein Dmel_CG5421, isoform B [Drosophila melanogaster]|eukprot:NP_001260418.1 uncharacterized protein Dmel_CG5421, isoform B [Drosophila melanogaster]